MTLKRLIRETVFQMARHDLAIFLEEHEAELLQIFREEMQQLDESIHEEGMFIDIKMVALGETVVKAALNGLRRFLTEDAKKP